MEANPLRPMKIPRVWSEMKNEKIGLFTAVAAVIVMAMVGAWYFKARARPQVAPVESVPRPVAEPAPAAIVTPVETLPALEQSDDWLRKKAATLSSDARFHAWLAPDDLIARWVGAVNMIGAGKVPVDGLSFLRPRRKFRPKERDERLSMDPHSYDRYNAFAEAFSSLDSAAIANLFRIAQPLIDAAWSNLGEARGGIIDGVAKAASELLAAPVSTAPEELQSCEKAVNYCYVDESLERRSLAQKQLMRMGPRNQRLIQAKIRELALALGVPNSRL